MTERLDYQERSVTTVWIKGPELLSCHSPEFGLFRFESKGMAPETKVWLLEFARMIQEQVGEREVA